MEVEFLLHWLHTPRYRGGDVETEIQRQLLLIILEATTEQCQTLVHSQVMCLHKHELINN